MGHFHPRIQNQNHQNTFCRQTQKTECLLTLAPSFVDVCAHSPQPQSTTNPHTLTAARQLDRVAADRARLEEENRLKALELRALSEDLGRMTRENQMVNGELRYCLCSLSLLFASFFASVSVFVFVVLLNHHHLHALASASLSFAHTHAMSHLSHTPSLSHPHPPIPTHTHPHPNSHKQPHCIGARAACQGGRTRDGASSIRRRNGRRQGARKDGCADLVPRVVRGECATGDDGARGTGYFFL